MNYRILCLILFGRVFTNCKSEKLIWKYLPTTELPQSISRYKSCWTRNKIIAVLTITIKKHYNKNYKLCGWWTALILNCKAAESHALWHGKQDPWFKILFAKCILGIFTHLFISTAFDFQFEMWNIFIQWNWNNKKSVKDLAKKKEFKSWML